MSQARKPIRLKERLAELIRHAPRDDLDCRFRLSKVADLARGFLPLPPHAIAEGAGQSAEFRDSSEIKGKCLIGLTMKSKWDFML